MIIAESPPSAPHRSALATASAVFRLGKAEHPEVAVIARREQVSGVADRGPAAQNITSRFAPRDAAINLGFAGVNCACSPQCWRLRRVLMGKSPKSRKRQSVPAHAAAAARASSRPSRGATAQGAARRYFQQRSGSTPMIPMSEPSPRKAVPLSGRSSSGHGSGRSDAGFTTLQPHRCGPPTGKSP
jgi:hypothetical protein